MEEVVDYSKYVLIAEGGSACTYGLDALENTEDPLVQIKRQNIAEKNSKLIQELDLPGINKKQEQLIYQNTKIEEVRANFPRGDCHLQGELKLVKIPNGGKDLEKLQVPSEDIYDFFYGFINIFEAIESLHKANIIHLDIKPMNMVGKINISPDRKYKYNLRLIDFGISRKIDKETDNRDFYYYDGKYYTRPYNYPYWSYDLRLLNQSFYTILCSSYIKRDITNFLVKVEGEIGGESELINEFMSNQLTPSLITTKLLEYLKEPSTQEGTKLEILLKSDTFALGLSLYIIYRRLTGSKPISNNIFYYISKDKSKANRAVLELVVSMCDPNPYSRLSLEVAKEAYITNVLPAIKKAYPSVQDVGNGARAKANAGLGGGSRSRRKNTKRNYLKAKKTRAKPKRK